MLVSIELRKKALDFCVQFVCNKLKFETEIQKNKEVWLILYFVIESVLYLKYEHIVFLSGCMGFLTT